MQTAGEVISQHAQTAAESVAIAAEAVQDQMLGLSSIAFLVASAFRPKAETRSNLRPLRPLIQDILKGDVLGVVGETPGVDLKLKLRQKLRLFGSSSSSSRSSSSASAKMETAPQPKLGVTL